MLYLCISQSCLSLSTAIIAHLSSILLFLFIAQTVLSFTAVIDAHPSFILLFSFFFCFFSFSFSFFFHSSLFCSFFLHFTDLTLTLDSHFCASNLHSALLCIPQILLSLLSVISVHLSSTLLFFVCCTHTWLSLSTVTIAYVSSILLFLCIPQTLLLVLRVISAHLSSMCSSYAFHRSCSHFQCQSFLKMGARICSFYATKRHSSHSQQSLLYFQAQLCFF